jgi:hypothetical protein
LLPFAIKHPEPTAQGKQRHPKLKFQHSSGHSPNDLAGLLSESLSLSEPSLIIANKPNWGIFMDGPTGDRLIVSSTLGLSVTIAAYNYRKPRLTLD